MLPLRQDLPTFHQILARNNANNTFRLVFEYDLEEEKAFTTKHSHKRMGYNILIYVNDVKRFRLLGGQNSNEWSNGDS